MPHQHATGFRPPKWLAGMQLAQLIGLGGPAFSGNSPSASATNFVDN
jgi:hypothetical protein